MYAFYLKSTASINNYDVYKLNPESYKYDDFVYTITLTSPESLPAGGGMSGQFVTNLPALGVSSGTFLYDLNYYAYPSESLNNSNNHINFRVRKDGVVFNNAISLSAMINLLAFCGQDLSSGGATVDNTEVLAKIAELKTILETDNTQIQTKVSDVKTNLQTYNTQIQTKVSEVKTILQTDNTQIQTKIDSLQTTLNNLNITLPTGIDFTSSLNGNFGSYKDGLTVNVNGVKGDYTVISSSLGWDSPSSGGLVIVYRLKNADNLIIEAPHVLVSLKV